MRKVVQCAIFLIAFGTSVQTQAGWFSDLKNIRAFGQGGGTFEQGER